eukprot:UN08915
MYIENNLENERDIKRIEKKFKELREIIEYISTCTKMTTRKDVEDILQSNNEILYVKYKGLIRTDR